ncbi:MAG: CRTAC1 family protein, partial [Planctomycetaceae bacterium]
FVANGHLQDLIDQYDRSTAYEVRNFVLRNMGDGRFENVSESAGDGMQVRRSSRGAAFDDLDNDGRIDVVILNSRREPTVLRNESPSSHHWVQVRLVGVQANRDAVGSRVIVVAGDLRQVAEVHSGRGYQSHFGSRLHFGLGRHDRIQRLEIRWHGGQTQVLENLPVDRLHTFIEPMASEPGEASRRGSRPLDGTLTLKSLWGWPGGVAPGRWTGVLLVHASSARQNSCRYLPICLCSVGKSQDENPSYFLCNDGVICQLD